MDILKESLTKVLSHVADTALITYPADKTLVTLTVFKGDEIETFSVASEELLQTETAEALCSLCNLLTEEI